MFEYASDDGLMSSNKELGGNKTYLDRSRKMLTKTTTLNTLCDRQDPYLTMFKLPIVR